MFNHFAGLGPGGLRKITDKRVEVYNQCVSGSSHGGEGDQGPVFKANILYDRENITSLLGGSGGRTVLLLSRIFPLFKFAKHSNASLDFIRPIDMFVRSFVCLSIFPFINIIDEWILKALRF